MVCFCDGGEYIPAMYNGRWLPVVRKSGESVVGSCDLTVDVRSIGVCLGECIDCIFTSADGAIAFLVLLLWGGDTEKE